MYRSAAGGGWEGEHALKKILKSISTNETCENVETIVTFCFRKVDKTGIKMRERPCATAPREGGKRHAVKNPR